MNNTITNFFYSIYENTKQCFIGKHNTLPLNESSYLLAPSDNRRSYFNSFEQSYLNPSSYQIVIEQPNYTEYTENNTEYVDSASEYIENNLKQLVSDSFINDDITINFENSIVLLSYNIENDVLPWKNRMNDIIKIINMINPDIITFQGCHTISKIELSDFMKDKLIKYTNLQFVGDENDCILIISVNIEKFTINHHGMKWLSQTPNIKSKVWDTNETSIIAYLNLINNKTKEKYWIFTTQLCKNNYYKILLPNVLLDLIKKITKNENTKIILSGNLNFNHLDNCDEIINSILEINNKMIYSSKNIYAYVDKEKIKINGTLIGTFNSNKYPIIENKTYGKYDFFITENIDYSICYTMFLGNKITIEQPTSYLPLILYIKI